MARRKLKPYLAESSKLPVTKWQDEQTRLQQEYRAEETEYSKIYHETRSLTVIRHCVDQAMNKILVPAAYKIRHSISSPNPESKGPYGWQDSTVVSVPKHRAVFPNTNERIIEDDAFEKAQEIRQQRHRRTKLGKSNMFSGLVYCADCGSKMHYDSSNQCNAEQGFFKCALHRRD